jgi:hypothetical protein
MVSILLVTYFHSSDAPQSHPEDCVSLRSSVCSPSLRKVHSMDLLWLLGFEGSKLDRTGNGHHGVLIFWCAIFLRFVMFNGNDNGIRVLILAFIEVVHSQHIGNNDCPYSPSDGSDQLREEFLHGLNFYPRLRCFVGN